MVTKLLESEYLGRPLRKVIYLVSKLCQRLCEFVEWAEKSHPYLLKLDRTAQKSRLQLAAKYYLGLKDATELLEKRPLVSVVLMGANECPEQLLCETLDSLLAQTYAHWELIWECGLDSTRNSSLAVRQRLEKLSQRMVVPVEVGKPGINSLLSASNGSYVATVRCGDRVYPNALAEVVRFINVHSEPDILYADERAIDAAGEKVGPIYFKPGWSPWFEFSTHYVGDFLVYKKAFLANGEWFQTISNDADEFDLLLRATDVAGYRVVHIPMCLFQSRVENQKTLSARQKIVASALSRRKVPGEVAVDSELGNLRLRLDVLGKEPLVSIVIPSKNSLDVLRQCIESIDTLSSYRNWEIVISDNGSDDPGVLTYYKDLEKRLDGRFRVIRKEAPFNFARQVNIGIEASTGSYVLVLNNDTEVISPSWIEELLMYCQFDSVGAVGCKLLFPDQSIQHAGIVNAGRDLAYHAGINEPATFAGYFGYLNAVHEVLAVTAACFMVKKDDWAAVGKFDEVYLANGYGDLEFCMKLKKLGKDCVYTPHAILYHHESKSRGSNVEYFERFLMLEKFGQDLLSSDYLNPNLRFSHDYKTNNFYTRLDLNAAEFQYFMRTEQHRWMSDIGSVPGLVS